MKTGEECIFSKNTLEKYTYCTGVRLSTDVTINYSTFCRFCARQKRPSPFSCLRNRTTDH